MQEELSFGVWLRKQRRALDLTRQAFADQVGCAEVTVRRIEAGTLKPSKELANLLLEKLGTPEGERSRWISFARGISGFPSQPFQSLNKPKSNLPTPLTTFIGREKEQLDIIQLITKHRLVTLTGSGGVGKTRLSIKIGEQILGNYPDGVWLVELAPILDPLLVPRTVAIAIGLRDEPQRPVIDMLSDYLRQKQTLIILDNCEHLVDACAHLAETLLKCCPSLKILATSRQVLGILGEVTYRVPSLGLPDLKQPLDNLRGYESIRLFDERAQLAQVNFSLTTQNSPTIARICAYLDGIPLAIELAAARISSFSAEQIATRLQENFSFLTTGNRTALPRHQTLQGTIDWSYNLLSPAEQTLFRRLSVFVNGWTLEAAESICSDATIKSESILDLLTQLINKSLVTAEEMQGETRGLAGGSLRYHMLETVRQYANEKLVESGKSDTLRDGHLEYFLNLAETAEPYLIRPEQIEWLPLLDVDYENLRLALDWSLGEKTAEASLRLCRALGWFWVLRCYWLEGSNWLTKALIKPVQATSKNEKVARAKALYTCAMLEQQLGNFEQASSLAKASLALALEVSDKKDIAIARYSVGDALGVIGEDDDQARSLLEQSFAEFQALGEPFWQARSFPGLGYLLVRQAKLRLRDVILMSLELARKSGERVTLADALFDYVDLLFRNNQVDEAREHAEEADRIYKELGREHTNVNSLLFADIAWSNGDYQKARALYIELQEHLSLLGERYWTSICLMELGHLVTKGGNLHQAQAYLEQALTMVQEMGYKPVIAGCLAHLSNLFYLQGNLDGFKQNFKESLSLRNYFNSYQKACNLMVILGSLYFQNPEASARLMGVVHNYERESEFPLKPSENPYWERAEVHARKTLGSEAFESSFAKGQKMSLDEGLDLALKTVEEM